MKKEMVLCGASSYEKKYYFNEEDFFNLPQSIKDELQILCVTFTEEIGGILTIAYDAEGGLHISTQALEADAMYDEIGAALRIKQLQKDKAELFRALELYYTVFILGEGMMG